jgi:nucleotide-binding universal stress UspA family protein
MENILTAVDFSASSKNAAEYAASLAGYFGAKLTLYHTYHIPALGFEAGYVPPITDMKEETEEEMKKWMVELSDKFKGVEIDYLLEMGFAADTIENAARERQADLIVLGLTGQSNAIKEHILGSVATKVAETSRIPVLIVPEHVRYTKIKKLSYACDFDKDLESSSILMKVKYFASLFDAELQILNVMKPEEEISVEKAETDSFIEEKLQTTKHNTFFIYDNKVDKGVIEFIDHHKTDILITCPKTHGFFHHVFSESLTKRLAFHSPVPILTIHENRPK